MGMRKILFFCFVITLGTSIVSCDGNKYKFGRSSKKNYDSLFLGLYLGMDRQAFFDRCFELNRERIATNGGSVQSVLHVLDTELDQPVIMEFYPTFYSEKIIEMPVVFTYEGWAPWNKEYGSDSLLVKLIPVFKKWYGDGFQLLDHETMGKVYVKMDGNRRINLFIRDDRYVQAVFSDMELLRERKNEESKIPKTEDVE
jgi:hypothetical protein